MSDAISSRLARIAQRTSAEKTAIWKRLREVDPKCAELLTAIHAKFGKPDGVALGVGSDVYLDGDGRQLAADIRNGVTAVPTWKPTKWPGISRGKSRSMSANPTGEKAA